MVSVIVPNYNHALYLHERIESILLQSYTEFELILLDDCSTDNSQDILNSYRNNPHVSHIVFNEKNSGSTFVQWQRGFSLAKGEYIWIAESDDKAESDLLKECVNRLDANPDIILAYSNSNYIDQDGNVMGISIDEPKKYCNNGIYDARTFCRTRMIYKNIIYNASMAVFRKSALAHVTNDFMEYRYCGDWCFWFDMLYTDGKVAEVPLKLNNYRQHLNKVSMRVHKSGAGSREVARCQLRMADILGLSSYQRQCLRGRLTKRIHKASEENLQETINLYPELYKGSWWDILIYEIDKYTGFSGMRH